MTYTLHTWEIKHTLNGPTPINIVQRSTTNHSELISMLKDILGSDIQFYVDRKRSRKQTVKAV